MNKNPSEQMTTMETPVTQLPRKMSRRATLIVGSGVAGLALLGGAAYLAGRLLNPPASASSAGDGRRVNLNPVPSPDLPQTEPTLIGLYVRRQDNSLFIGSGLTKGPNGLGYNGPVVEVVTNHDTALYQDITQIDYRVAEQGTPTPQKLAHLNSLDELLAAMEQDNGRVVTYGATYFLIWGARTGDRIVASTVLYHPAPTILNMPPPPPDDR
jgi:hypothetical protein